MNGQALRLVLPSGASAPEAFAASSNPVGTSRDGTPLPPAEARPPWSAAPPAWAAEATAPWGSAPQPSPLPPATLGQARSLRDALAGLISAERAAAADFLVALSDFDRRRGWEVLGYASLFGFLTRELRLSGAAAYARLSAARLIPRFPEVEAALRDGRLCATSAGEVAKVLTPANQAEVLPRFFGCSSREAKEVVAALRPRAVPPRREVITRLPTLSPLVPAAAAPSGFALGGGAGADPEPDPGSFRDTGGNSGSGSGADAGSDASSSAGSDLGPAAGSGASPASARRQAAGEGAAGDGAAGRPVGRCDMQASSAAATSSDAQAPGPQGPHRVVRAPEVLRTPLDDRAPLTKQSTIEPLSADLRRIHLTVDARFTDKLATARRGLAHARPGARIEEVLEAALDLLLKQQARRRGAARRERPEPAHPEAARPEPARPGAPVAAGRATDARRIPAAIRREVWARDGHRCQYPLDSGGICASTHRLELDHLWPVALGGASTADNLRVLCQAHNLAAARRALGEARMADRRPRRGDGRTARDVAPGPER